MSCNMEAVKASPAVPNSRNIQEPVKVHLPKDRLIPFSFQPDYNAQAALSLELATLAEENKMLATQNLHIRDTIFRDQNLQYELKILQIQEAYQMMSEGAGAPIPLRQQRISHQRHSLGNAPITKLHTSTPIPDLSSITQPNVRTSISEISTNCSSGIASPDQSDDEEGIELPAVVQTTIVMKNLSQSCTRKQIVELLDSHGFRGGYDLVYVPVDFASMLSHCYAFVNFTFEEAALEFLACGASTCGFSQSACVGDGGSEISWALGMQGLQAAIEKYRNSPVMHASVPAECKPLLFESSRIVPFPKPTRKIQKPRGCRKFN